jgi:hypothetical protein
MNRFINGGGAHRHAVYEFIHAKSQGGWVAEMPPISLKMTTKKGPGRKTTED